MNKRRPVAEILLLVIGAVLSCCWLPQGLTGLIYLVQIVSPRFHMARGLQQFLFSASNPLSWYNQQIIQRFYMRGNIRVGYLLNAIPMCFCPLVAVAILVVAIVLYARATRANREETV